MDGSFQTVEKAAELHNQIHRKPTNKDQKFFSQLPSQAAGNLAVQRLLRSGVIQPKLAVSQPGDVHEQEADRIAEQVMRMPDPALQRPCAGCDSGATPCPACEEKAAIAQRKADHDSHAKSDSPSASVVKNLGSGRPLDSEARAFFEPRFGADLSHVRVHSDEEAAESARSVHALAYTLGRDMVFASGQYAPDTVDGRRLIAHELAHVLQQDQKVVHRYVAQQGPVLTDSCAGWENDPESFSIHVARHFVRTEVNPALANKAVSVTCQRNNDCIVKFGDDLSIDVSWVKTTRRVGAGRWTDQGRQFCAYNYSCDPMGQLNLSTLRCYGTPKP